VAAVPIPLASAAVPIPPARPAFSGLSERAILKDGLRWLQYLSSN
jgi:hypothetical protein